MYHLPWCDWSATMLVKNGPNELALNNNRPLTLQWRHNERDGVSNHQPHDCADTVERKLQSSESLALWGEFTDDWWNPLTKCQQSGKYFYFMTSLWTCTVLTVMLDTFTFTILWLSMIFVARMMLYNVVDEKSWNLAALRVFSWLTLLHIYLGNVIIKN